MTSPARSREGGPDLLHDHTNAGAEAYVEDYLARLNQAWTTPQASLLDNRASKACGTCSNFRTAAAGLTRAGQRHESPMLAVTNVSVVIWHPHVRVVVDASQPAHDLLDRAGRTVSSVGKSRVNLYVDLTYRGRWWIDKIGIESVSDDNTYNGPGS